MDACERFSIPALSWTVRTPSKSVFISASPRHQLRSRTGSYGFAATRRLTLVRVRV